MSNPHPLYDPDRNGTQSYALAIAAAREMGIREGSFEPINAMERDWADEGSVPLNEFESVRIFQEAADA